MSGRLALLLLVLGGLLAAQDTPTDDPPAQSDWRREVQKLELRSADSEELREWARRLDLPAEGTDAQLRGRIATRLGITLDDDTTPKRTVTIESARRLSAFTLESIDEDYIRITGGVSITLRDTEQDTSHRITADTLLLNQRRNLLEARGNVTYTLTKGSRTEVFRGQGLVFQLQDWMGIFYGGVSERDRNVGGQTLRFRFEGGEIRRSGQDVVILNQGLVTSSVQGNPYYSIRASKIYILAPGEWGFSNAFLYIGRVPVFYFPIYFQPGDEMWFNPVVGLPDPSDRRGTYLQTTTYLFGRKKQEDSPFSFLQFTDRDDATPRVWRGLYLVRDPEGGGTPADRQNWTLKVLADLYTNLGLYTGLQGNLSNLGPVSNWDLLAGIAVSRNVYPGQPWKPYVFDPNAEVWEQSVWNRSLLLGTEVPFRYRFETRAQAQGWNLGWEYWSDPFLGEDFGQRSETFTPFALVGFGPKPASASESKKTSLSWFVGGSLPVDTRSMTPWVRTLSISPLELRLDHNAKAHPDFSAPDPSREWFHPARFVSPNLRVNLAGEVFRWSSDTVRERPPILLPPELRPEEPAPSPPPEPLEPALALERPPSPALPDPLRPATPGPTSSAPRTEVSLTYNLTGGWQTDGDYLFTPWLRPQDVDWRVRFTRNQYATSGNASLRSNLVGGFLQTEHSLSFTDRSRWTWYTDPSLTLMERNALFAADAQNVSTQVTTQNNLTLSPLLGVFLLRQTSVGYSLAFRVYERRFLSYDPGTQTASYQEFFPEWDPQTISTHEARFSLPVTPFEDAQLLNLSLQGRTTLEPRPIERNLSVNLSSRVGIVQNTLSAGLRGTQTEWTPDLLRWTLEVSPFGWRFTNSLEYDLKKERWNSATATLTGYGWVLRYYHTQTIPYYFDPVTKKWVAGFAGGGYTPGETYFLPLEASVTYQLPQTTWTFWDDWAHLTLGANVAGNVNLQQYTNAALNFSLTSQLRIVNYLDLSFAVTSTNRAFYRYLPGLSESLGLNLETVNFLEDIAFGFAFWDDTLRKQSSFKLSRLSLGLTHLMPDWSLAFRLEATPRLEGTPQQYVWSVNYSFLFLWKPFEEIRNDLKVDDKGNLTVNTKQ